MLLIMGDWGNWHPEHNKYLIYNMLNIFCESPCEYAA